MSSKLKKNNQGLVKPIPNSPEYHEALLKGLDTINARILVNRHYAEKDFLRIHKTINSLRHWVMTLIVLMMLAATGTVCNLMLLDGKGIL